MSRPVDPMPPGGFPETSLGGYLPTGRRTTPQVVGPTGGAALVAFQSAAARLEEIIDHETAALAERRAVDLDEINRLKSRSLLELTRLIRVLPEDVGDRLSETVLPLHRKLLRNQAVLRLHLEAVQEIAGLLANTLGEFESDGTYEMARRRPGGAR